MDNGHQQKAGASCLIKYDAKCVYCKDKVLQIMRSVNGNNYDVIIDAQKGIVSMNAEVDPNIFVAAINLDYGNHGDLIRARITKVDNKSNEVSFGCAHNNNNFNHHYNNHHALLEGGGGVCHGLPAMAGGIPAGDGVVIYPNGLDNYRRQDGMVYPSGFENHPRACNNACCRPVPEAVWVPSYPPQHGNYYPDQYGSGINCNIM